MFDICYCVLLMEALPAASQRLASCTATFARSTLHLEAHIPVHQPLSGQVHAAAPGRVPGPELLPAQLCKEAAWRCLLFKLPAREAA